MLQSCLRGSSATDEFTFEEWSKQIPNRTTIIRETGYCPQWPAAADRQSAAGEPPGPLLPSATSWRPRDAGLLRDPAGQEQTRIVSRQEEDIQATLRFPHAPTLADLMLHRPFRRRLTRTEVGRVASKPRPHRNRIHPVHRTVTVVSTDCHDCRKLDKGPTHSPRPCEEAKAAPAALIQNGYKPKHIHGPHVVPTWFPRDSQGNDAGGDVAPL